MQHTPINALHPYLTADVRNRFRKGKLRPSVAEGRETEARGCGLDDSETLALRAGDPGSTASPPDLPPDTLNPAPLLAPAPPLYIVGCGLKQMYELLNCHPGIRIKPERAGLDPLYPVTSQITTACFRFLVAAPLSPFVFLRSWVPRQLPYKRTFDEQGLHPVTDRDDTSTWRISAAWSKWFTFFDYL
ncbi:hypothetical protein K488DRAFT_70030 [Vararia minispora EC-137]|uniref:Uncharacterized protein n=1 Tax=Vararia minispora EC-137 TaxID=1314806 RepID=A0ACB8QPB7_9AGAM|nr:hypothetical protein K488DRAFT_70030 [Vararia minispora EC-137]